MHQHVFTRNADTSITHFIKIPQHRAMGQAKSIVYRQKRKIFKQKDNVCISVYAFRYCCVVIYCFGSSLSDNRVNKVIYSVPERQQRDVMFCMLCMYPICRACIFEWAMQKRIVRVIVMSVNLVGVSRLDKHFLRSNYQLNTSLYRG